MKNRTIIASTALLIALFVTVTAILPRTGLQTVNLANSYMERVFNKSKVTNVDITMSPKDLQSILENPLDEEMVQANVVVDGVKMDGVGIRTKGNMTLRSVAQMEDSDRYSFKIDFDHYNDDENLYGLKKLNLNNNYSDPSQMREYLSYELMEKMGVPTPGYSYMYVTINGKEWGLYLGVEAIEEPYLQRNFTDSTGDLYKPDGTGSDLKWISDDIKDYTGLNLKTNPNSKQTNLMKLLDVINNGGKLADVADVDEMLKYFAANTALVSLDSYQGSMKHNYYLYEENGKFSVLPWDYNMAFGGFGVGGMGGGGGGGMPGQDGPDADANGTNAADELNNAEAGADHAKDGTETDGAKDAKSGADANAGKDNTGANAKNDAQNNAGANHGNAKGNAANGKQGNMGQGRQGMGGGMGGDMAANFLSDNNINFSITTPVSGTTLTDRPLLKALLSVDDYKEKYNTYLQQIADGFFKEDNIQALTTQISSLISSYVDKDPTKFYTTEQLLEAASGDKSLVKFTTERAESIRKQLSGELVVEAITNSDKSGGGFGGQAPGMQGQGQGGDDQNQANGQDQADRQGQADANGQNQDNGQPPALPDGQNQGNRQPPDRQGGQMQGNMQPPGGQGNGGNRRGPGGMGGMPGMGGPNQQNVDSGKFTTMDIIIAAVFVVLLIGAILFALLFKRRGTRKRMRSDKEPRDIAG